MKYLPTWTIFLFVPSLKIFWKYYANIIIDLLNDLGFHISFKKSSIKPSHTLIHLGYISLPSDKTIKTKKFAYYLIHNRCSLREISSFFSLVVNHSSAFKCSPLHHRRIQLRYINIKQGKDYNDIFSFDESSMDGLYWWSPCPDSRTPFGGFIPFSPDLTSLYWYISERLGSLPLVRFLGSRNLASWLWLPY